MKSLYEKLINYGESDFYGFHMPGHKRNSERMENGLPYQIDITEIEGFDDLHHARELLKEAQERAARVYHAEETCYLINGSTSGILSGVLGCTRKGGRVLAARNCHKSVYAAIYMNELDAEYIYPEYDEKNGLNGAIDAEEIRRILLEDRNGHCGNTTISAVVLTSPTYDGVVSDIRRIADTVHEFGIPLIVDEAHGAHFGFHSYFPENANQQGADVVIHSLHKTLPSLTQTALIHLNGNLVNRERVRKYVHMIQTSSPSYVLMASMDECIRFLEREQDAFGIYQERLEKLRRELSGLKNLQLVETNAYDRSKIVISTKNTVKGQEVYTGKLLYEELLVSYHLQMEMASREYVLAMTSVCDTEEGFRRLKEALFQIDESLERKEIDCPSMELPRLQRVYTSAQAENLSEEKSNVEILLPEECQERISLEYAYVYPPGIPLIVPGERISKKAVELLQIYEKSGFDIEGLKQSGRMQVLKEIPRG